MLAAARARDRAPAALRERIDRERVRARPVVRRRRRVFAGGLTAALAAAAVALALALPAGTPGSPSVSEAASLALRGPAAPPPVLRPGKGRLGASVNEVYFPDWQAIGWHAAGQRHDRLADHTAVTVYYHRGGAWVAYTILGVPSLPEPSGPAITARGLSVRALAVHGRTVVSWRRGQDTCVLSSADLSAHQLAALAATEPPAGD